MLFTGLSRSVWEKNCALGLEYGPRPVNRTADKTIWRVE